jgi:hypothetical protein
MKTSWSRGCLRVHVRPRTNEARGEGDYLRGQVAGDSASTEDYALRASGADFLAAS